MISPQKIPVGTNPHSNVINNGSGLFSSEGGGVLNSFCVARLRIAGIKHVTSSPDKIGERWLIYLKSSTSCSIGISLLFL